MGTPYIYPGTMKTLSTLLKEVDAAAMAWAQTSEQGSRY